MFFIERGRVPQMQKEEVKARLLMTIDKLLSDDGADTAEMIKGLRAALENGDTEEMMAACKSGLDYCESKKNDSFKAIVESLGGWIRNRLGAPVGLALKCITMHPGVTHYVGGPGVFMYVAYTLPNTIHGEGGEFELSCVIDARGEVSVDRGFRRYRASTNTNGLTMLCVWVDDSETVDVYEM